MVINQLITEPDKLWRLIKQQAFYGACNGNMEKHINPEKLEDDDRRRIVTVCVCRMYCIIYIVELRTPATPVGVGGGKERGGCQLNLRT